MSSFRLTATTIDIAPLRAELADPANGGYASFEGWVRNHNDGLAVLRLEYQVYEALALREGERIIAEARARFGATNILCVHRTGSLQIGDVAVWVAASSAHRDEAFRACRQVIDAVKHRVPIWKKEHYVNGDSGWVNCERCAQEPSTELSHDHAHEHTHKGSR